MSTCTLCDLPIGDQPVTATDVETDADIEGEFCCLGCLEISKLIDAGEETELSVSEIRDRGDESERERNDREDAETAYRSVDGMHCKTCEGFIELLAEETEGVYGARASYATEMVELTYDPDVIDGDGLTAAISRLGYHASEPGAEDDGSLLSRFAFDRYRAGFAALLMMPVIVLYLLFIYPVYLGIYPEAFLYGSAIEAMVFGPLIVWSTLIVLGLGYPILRGAYVSLRVGQPNMDVLIALAVIAAYLYSVASYFTGGRDPYFDVAVMVLVVVTIGSHLETRVKRDALGNRSLLTESRITEARRQCENGTEMIDVGECTEGDHLLVKPGERVPVDGTVIDGTAAVDESLITGESIPETKSVGDLVLGGSVLTDSALVIEVGAEASSTIDRLVELLWNVKSADSGIQRLVNRFAVLFVPLVILIAMGTTLLWLALGAPLGVAVLTGVSVLVISCPCSLGIATPLALAAGSRDASRAGILLINETILERIEGSEIVVFDKTGTLTTGEMRVRDVISGSHTAESEVLARAAAVERRSSHPIAAAIEERAPQADRSVSEFERGERTVSALVDGERVVVGHPSAVETDDLGSSDEWSIPKSVREAIESAYRSGVHPTAVGWDGTVHGIITSADTPREGWETVLTELGINREIVVLTGDDERLSQEFADHPAVDHVFAGVRPESKKVIIGGLTERGTTTMVGDGTNDAPALARADLGIAVASGTEIAIEAADAVIMNDQLDSLSTIFGLARSTRERIKWNLVWAGLYNAIALPLAVASLITPLIAAVCMAVSSLVVVFNSKRSLISSEEDPEPEPEGRERTAEHTLSKGSDVIR